MKSILFVNFDPLPDIRVENEGSILRQAGYRVTCVTHKGDSPVFNKIYHVSRTRLLNYGWPMGSFAYWYQLRRIIKVEKPDLVYLHNAVYPLVIMLLKFSKIPTITDLHEYNSVNRLARNNTVRRVQGALFRIDEKIHTRLSDGYILVSHLLPSNTWFPIYHKKPRIALENFTTLKQAKMLSTPISEDTPKLLPPKSDEGIIRIGYVGAVAAIGGRDFRGLIPLVHEFEGKLEFFVVGAKTPRSDKNMHYLGRVTQDEAFQLLKEFDALIMNPLARYIHPVSPNKLYQYIATGKPLIVDNHPSVAHRKDVLSFLIGDYESKESMRKAFTNLTDNFEEINNATKKNVDYTLSHLTWEHQAKEFVAFVEEIIATRIR